MNRHRVYQSVMWLVPFIAFVVLGLWYTTVTAVFLYALLNALLRRF